MDFYKFVESKSYRVLDFFFKLLFINLLWLVTSTIGFGILTIMPAAIATYVLINSMMSGYDFPIIQSFFRVFVKEYWRVQKRFFILVLIGFIVYLDIDFFYQLVKDVPSATNTALLLISLFFGMLYLLILIHIGLVYIFFPRLSSLTMIKLSLLMAFRHIVISLLILGGIVFAFVIIQYLPIIGSMIVLFSFALYVYLSLRYLRPKYEVLIEGSDPLLVKDY